MKTKKEREKIVKDLVNTFNDRDELHEAYKSRMKEIILYAMNELGQFYEDNPDIDEIDLVSWIDNFVEERFKPQ